MQIEGTENRIAQSRRTFNEAVQDYNRATRRFPSSIVAGLFNFGRRTPFRADPAAATPPNVDLGVAPSTAPAGSGPASTP